MDKVCCGFTGFRPGRFYYKYNEEHPECQLLKYELYGEIINKCMQGVNTFYTGMAMGIDMWAAEAVLKAKKEFFYNINLIAVIPFYQHKDTIDTIYHSRYDEILKMCTDIVYTCEEYHPSSYKIRNEYIVDHCDYMIAVYDEANPKYRSGTASTVRYAQKMNRDITFISPYQSVNK